MICESILHDLSRLALQHKLLQSAKVYEGHTTEIVTSIYTGILDNINRTHGFGQKIICVCSCSVQTFTLHLVYGKHFENIVRVIHDLKTQHIKRLHIDDQHVDTHSKHCKH